MGSEAERSAWSNNTVIRNTLKYGLNGDGPWAKRQQWETWQNDTGSPLTLNL